MSLRYYFLFALFICPLVVAEEDSAQQLEEVKAEITTLSQDLAENKASKESLFNQLRQQSIAISNLNKDLYQLEHTIAQQSAILKQLKQQQQQQQTARQQQFSALSKQLRSAYINSQPNIIKVLLNQHEPATLARNNQYYRYFHQARAQQLNTISELLASIQTDQQLVAAAQKEQQQLHEQQLQKQQALKEQSQQRQITLALLDQKISSQDARLNQLQQQQQALNKLLKSLDKPTKTIAFIPSEQHIDFARRAGSLAWPIKGKLLARYGRTRHIGELTWQGIVISAPQGDTILATAPGNIIFADWLRGFGLLLIIDHGDQYMTLYGNNETLLKQVGDTVSTGELIAQSGNNGVQHYAGLYFEVRHKGKPNNPLKWLSK